MEVFLLADQSFNWDSKLMIIVCYFYHHGAYTRCDFASQPIIVGCATADLKILHTVAITAHTTGSICQDIDALVEVGG